MRIGSRGHTVPGSGCGNEVRRPRWGLSAFLDDEGGYTTVAMAVAMLVSLTLVFGAASAQWLVSRSAEAQEVADAAAMAGANAVSAYTTIVQTLDACVLSMGLTGMVVYAGGLVACCVPSLAATGAELVDAGAKVLDARRSFAKSAAEGLQRLEALLPAIVVANSASCVLANSEEGLAYAGCAVPYPQQSLSDFSAILADADDSPLPGIADDLKRAAAEEDEAKKRTADAKRRGWLADCGQSPYCMWQRADTLAGLDSGRNPFYASPDTWGFGVGLERARHYYEARLSGAQVSGANGEQLTDSACIRAFYAFALEEVRKGSYVEKSDGSVQIDFPSLPHNAAETRETSMYGDSCWPCTVEEGGRTIHSSLACPGAKGAASGTASVADEESGAVKKCPECRMGIGNLGRAAAASTSIENGFEHWWREFVEASKEYEAAKNEQVAARKRLKEKAKEGFDVFRNALDALSVPRPKMCPPGAWGCVAVVARGEGNAVPSELTSSFLTAMELPAGAAVSAAVLAPDSATAENNVLSSFFDGLSSQGSLAGSVLDGVMTLWGRLMVAYGSAYESVGSAGSDFLDKLDGVLGGSVGSWLKSKISEAMHSLGLDPGDMRLRKPVLTNTQNVLSKAGYDRAQTVRSLVTSLPDTGNVGDYLKAFGIWAAKEYGDEDFTVAELTVPGTDIKIPLKVNLAKLAGSL